MPGQNSESPLSDHRGTAPWWVALALAVMFALGALIAVLIGEGRWAWVLTVSFAACFNEAFGRKAVIPQVASLFRRPTDRPPNSGE
jgi:hypothetical protein